MREFIQFECTTCHCRNYTSRKNKKAKPERIEISKFCPFCRKHTSHKEQK